jgi:aspartate racemase
MAKTVGILGGMGPLATVDLFAKIVENTPAAVDQDHLRIIIDNNPQIPPRVEALQQGGESPLPAMAASARLLEAAGADFIVMPCNTAHYWIEGIREAVTVPVYSMIDNAADHVAKECRNMSGRILLLATGATVDLGLYQEAFAARDMALLLPAAAEQEMINAAIKQVKRGAVADNPYLDRLNGMLAKYAASGTAAFLAGCTELPLLFPYVTGTGTKLDATLLLARMAVAKAGR